MRRLVASLVGYMTLSLMVADASQATSSHRPRSAAASEVLAAERGDTAEVRALLAGTDPNARDEKHQRTALMWAILRNDQVAFQRLLKASPDLNALDDRNRTLLAIAVESTMDYDSTPVVEALIAKGATVPAMAPGGMSLLMMAANTNSIGIVRSLLPILQPAAIDAAGPDGATALGVAAMMGARDIVYMLLEKGARIDRADFDGRTPLIRAASGRFPGTLETVTLLLEMGANPSAKDKKGNTAIGEAQRRGSAAVVDLLKKAGARDAPSAQRRRGGHRAVAHLSGHPPRAGSSSEHFRR